MTYSPNVFAYNYPKLLLLGICFLLFNPIIWIPVLLWVVYKLLVDASYSWEFKNDEMIIRWGLFSQEVRELKYYRVKGTSTYYPFIYRIIGYGEMKIETSDPLTNNIKMFGFSDLDEIRQDLWRRSELARRERNITEYDINRLN